MAKKKKVQGEQKWLIVGVVVLLLGGWWIFKSMQQGAKVALVDENGGGETNGTVYAMPDVWAYGKKSVKPDVTPALKAWISTLKVREGDGSAVVTVEKRAKYCEYVKFGDGREYSGKYPYIFGLSARVTPKGMAVTDTSELMEVAQRKWLVTFFDNRGKTLASGSTDVPVLAVVAGANGPSSMDDGGDGSGGGSGSTVTKNKSALTGLPKSNGTDLYKVAVTPAKEFVDKDALKIFKMQFCLDTSNTDAVDVELTDMAWLLDTKYIGPAEQVDRAVIVY